MKKIFAAVLGMSLMLGSVSVSFAQDTTKKPAKAKKVKKSKTDTTKK